VSSFSGKISDWGIDMKYASMLSKIDKLHEQIRAYRPLDAHELQQLKEYFRIGLTYSSNALEGNSLTESETKVVIEEGITVGGKPLKDHYEAIGHSEAFDLLFRLATNRTITKEDILGLHQLFYFRINAENAGKFRQRNVIITGTDYLPPSHADLPGIMQEFIDEIPSLQKNHPVIYAAQLHLKLATIHPFMDGNGRTARLLMNLALLQNGFPITIIPPLLRADYISALRESNRGNNEMFLNFISCCVWESQREYLRLLSSLDS
jgi:Fic family protein